MTSKLLCDHPHRPDYAELREQIKKRGLSEANKMSKLAMGRQYSLPPEAGRQCTAHQCLGQLDVGFFFDGTGNNKDRDYGPEKSPFPFLKRKHSNVVRLYHAFPDEDDENPHRHTKDTLNRIYRYYIPGVGTPFPEIGDKEEAWNWAVKSISGNAAGYGCEARILWAMVQALNAIGRFYTKEPVISDDEAKEAMSTFTTIPEKQLGTPEWKNLSIAAAAIQPLFGAAINSATSAANAARGPGGANKSIQTAIYKILYRDEVRRAQFRKWIDEKLKPYMTSKRKPQLAQVNLHVFGFSRGAAEARTFVNYLCELGDGVGGTIDGGAKYFPLFGIPVRIQFMGLFDTVASVGIAGLYSFSEGHMAWANDTQQIPSLVGKCVHMVAAHETRACFPLDSVRIYDKYRPNYEEIVYPGAHSDLGGGYALRALGKNDLGDGEEEDCQIARAPCFDMYSRALASGVPFYTLDQLTSGFPDLGKVYVNNILPSLRVIETMAEYDSLTDGAGSVESQLQQHAALYLGWRWSLGKHYFTRAASMDAEIQEREKRIAVAEAKIAELDKELAELNEKKRGGFFGSKDQAMLAAAARWNTITGEEKPEWVAKHKEAQEQLAKIKNQRAQYDTPDGGLYYCAEIRRTCANQTKQVKQQQGADETNAEKEAQCLENTQREIIQVVAAYCHEIDRRLALLESGQDKLAPQPLANTLNIIGGGKKKNLDKEIKAQRDRTLKTALGLMKNLKSTGKVARGGVGLLITVGNAADFIKERMDLLKKDFHNNAKIAKNAIAHLKKWREGMREAGIALEHDELAPEREGMLLLEGLEKWDALPAEKKAKLAGFFEDYIHDSEAGFRMTGMPEFELNGYGMAKFRTVFFGDTGNYFQKQVVEQENEERRARTSPARKTRNAVGQTKPGDSPDVSKMNVDWGKAF